jgi:transcriptional regulator of acetoin/glycerol metabolism
VLVRDLATLSVDQQRALSSWLDQVGPGHVQIVSTNALPLFPLVEQGVFLEALYYRLNTLRLGAPVHMA